MDRRLHEFRPYHCCYVFCHPCSALSPPKLPPRQRRCLLHVRIRIQPCRHHARPYIYLICFTKPALGPTGLHIMRAVYETQTGVTSTTGSRHRPGEAMPYGDHNACFTSPSKPHNCSLQQSRALFVGLVTIKAPLFGVYISYKRAPLGNFRMSSTSPRLQSTFSESRREATRQTCHESRAIKCTTTYRNHG